MTRTKHILALLTSLVALAALAPAASAATSPNPFKHVDPNAWRYSGSVDPNSEVHSVGADRRKFFARGIGTDRRKFHGPGIGPNTLKVRS